MTTYSDETLADMRDTAETPAELRAAVKYARAMAGEAMESGDWLGHRMYRSTADEIERRYWAARRARGDNGGLVVTESGDEIAFSHA